MVPSLSLVTLIATLQLQPALENRSLAMSSHLAAVPSPIFINSKIVAKSTVEAEYVALGPSNFEALYLRQIVTELGHSPPGTTFIGEDNNEACVRMPQQLRLPFALVISESSFTSFEMLLSVKTSF